MKRFQKALFALTAVVLLGWMGASTASAQVQFLASPSQSRPVRSEGLTEAVGTVILSAQSTGVIKLGSTISLNYGTAVEATSGTVGTSCVTAGTRGPIVTFSAFTAGAGYTASTPVTASASTVLPAGGTGATATLTVDGTGAVTAVALVAGGSNYAVGEVLTFTGGTFTTAATATVGTIAAGSFTKTVSGNVLTITAGTGDVGCGTGNSISITGVRVNANSIGAGNNVSVTASSSVPATFAASNAISIIQFVALTVATVQASPSTAVSGGSGILLLCSSSGALLTGTAVTLTVTENFNQAFLSLVDEQGLNNNTNVVAMGVTFSFTGIPVGMTLTASVSGSTSATLNTVLLNGAATAAFVSKTGQQDVDITANVDTDGTGTDIAGDPEKLVVVFTFTVPDKNLLQTAEATTPVKISFTGGGSGTTQVPRFTSNTQSTRDALKLLACASYILFPWVAYVADGTLDTGIAISNTTADPPLIGTRGQTGDVTLYFWTADGSTAPAPLKIATALGAGKSATFVASQIGKAYTGYVIAVCGFQMGHGLAAFLSPKAGVFGASYMGLQITNPRTVLGAGTAAPGAESLGQ